MKNHVSARGRASRAPLLAAALTAPLAAMMLAWPGSAMAAPQASGFLQLRLTQRLHSLEPCTVPACSQMVQQVLGELLLEPHLNQNANATLRVEAKTDQASGESRLSVREAYLDWGNNAAASLNLRLGRQILTWGVSDYLYVNDIFPKNYDTFFTGAGLDRIKQPVDALRLTTRVAMKANATADGVASEPSSPGGLDLELVLARAQADQAPQPNRFVAASGSRLAGASAHSSQADVALKLSTRLGSWDVAGYLADFQAREQRFAIDAAGLQVDQPRTRHLGMSITGNAAAGLIWLELALRQSDQDQAALVSRYYLAHAGKLIAGYSREVAQDTTASAQLQLEANLDYSHYLARLAPGIRPVSRLNAVLHLRLSSRWANQTVGGGVQLFIDGEGDTHINPFGSWSPADGWTIEGGANLFAGKPDTRFGVLKDDSNLYLLGRYSF